MCGINGIFSYHDQASPVSARELIATRDHMAARGPDAAGEWFNATRRVGLGQRRLAIIDLDPRASQPMHSADGRYAIVFNGEIYNYQALKDELQRDGQTFRTTSDTEVLIYLYARHGRDMLRRLRGMFAFAIYDAQADSLFLARDPYGIKPLYFANDGKTLRFASQVRALLAGGAISREPDPAGWSGFYTFGSVPEPYTTFKSIRALPAGHFLLLRAGATGAGEQQGIGTYHTLLEPLSAQRGLTHPNADVQAEASAALADSVRAHLVADVPVGAFLSGGIDSGALVGLMRDAGASDIKTITLTFDEYAGAHDDEGPLAQEVANLYSTRHTVRSVSQREFLADLPKFMAAMDQPSIDGLNMWFVSKAAAEQGLKVVVSGLGGDELFGGYPSFRQIPQSVRWLKPFAAAPSAGRLLRQAILRAGPKPFGLNSKMAGVAELGGTWEGAYLLRRGLFMPWELGAVMPAAIATTPSQFDPLEHIANAVPSLARDDFAHVSALESTLYMRNQLLRDADWTSMAHSLEARVPLVDMTLLTHMTKLPLDKPEFHGKKLLLHSPRTPLPTAIGSRAKTGFTTPIGRWIASLPDRAPIGALARRALDGHHWSRAWALEVAHRYAAETKSTLAGLSPSEHGVA